MYPSEGFAIAAPAREKEHADAGLPPKTSEVCVSGHSDADVFGKNIGDRGGGGVVVQGACSENPNGH